MKSPRGVRRARLPLAVGLAATAVLLALTLLDFPTVAYDVDHDLSSSASLEYFAAHYLQFGVQVIQNAGPLGWVHYSGVYAGFLHAEKLVLKSLLRLALVALVLWACARFPSRAARVAWLLAFLVILPIGGAVRGDVLEVNEVWAYLTAYLSGLSLLSLPQHPRVATRAAPVLLLLAFLALTKHTLFLAATLTVLAVALDRLRRRDRRSAALLPLVYAGFVALLWVTAGQRLENVIAYGVGMVRFTEGYNEAMALPADSLSTVLGFTVLGGLAALTSIRAALGRQSLAKSAIDLLFLFIVWKHGFVRADPAHLMIFFHAAVFFALLFGLAVEGVAATGGRSSGHRGRAAFAIASGGLALLSAGSLFSVVPAADYDVQRVTTLWKRNLDWILSPRRRTEELRLGLEESKRLYALPAVRELVRGARIDFFGYEPGWLLLNDMAYMPRPMPISFAASSPLALRRNEGFYRDARHAPRFVLSRLGSIDGRLVPLDDGLALGALLDNYHPVLLGGELLLLERNPAGRTRERVEQPVLIEREIRFGETLPIGAAASSWLWLEAHVKPSVLGRLRALLLRPAPVWIVLEGLASGLPETRRFVTSMGASGFLVSPLIENGVDLFEAYTTPETAAIRRRIRSVRFECASEDRVFFQDRLLVRLRQGEPPVPPPSAGRSRSQPPDERGG
jgi:hypothetical protein